MIRLTRLNWATLALSYAVVMLYSSTVIGPAGPNFVHKNPVEVLQQFLATPYVLNGSDQRADWMGNLLMLIPFGALVAGALWPRALTHRIFAAILALSVCVAVILAIKYLQLFFPPRTVTLNYIIAQSAGATLGILGWALTQSRTSRPASRRDPIMPWVVALRLYFGALLIFLLMPLDFALDAQDLQNQIARFPDTLWTVPGGGRSPEVRAILIAVAAAAFIPVGMLMTLIKSGVYRVQRGLWAITGLGLLTTTGIFAVTSMVISAYPAAPSILYRTAGILMGAAAIRWLVRQDPQALRTILQKSVPWLALPYLTVVLIVNHVLSTHWLSLHQAMEQAYPLGLLPLFDYYIVSKAAAAKNIVGHAVLYLPIGVMMWLRYGDRICARAGAIAAALCLAMETARYFRPGQEGDINAIAVAALSVMATVKLMPIIWSMLETLIRQSAATPHNAWHDRTQTNPQTQPAQQLGD